MRTILLVALAAFPLLAADVTVNAFVSVQPLLQGGEVSCNPAGTACVWATSQYSGATYSASEIAGCTGLYNNAGVFQCTNPPACPTCGRDNALFGYTVGPSTVQKGQPFFEDSTGNFLLLWVSAQGVTGGTCSTTTPGGGVCGDTWYMPIAVTTSTITLSAATNLTNILMFGGSANGVLYARTGGSAVARYIWLSYRLGNSLPPNLPSCSDGQWSIRVWQYTISGSTISPAELSGSPFLPIGTCTYIEMSGFYDKTSGEFTFQGTPNGTNPIWQSNIYGFNLNYPGSADMIVPWGTNGLYAWDEHASTDATNTLITWSSSRGATAGPYDGSQTTYGACGPTCTGLLPLDKWVAAIPRYVDNLGNSRLGQIATAYQLTQLNVLGSSDRAFICASDSGGCSNSTVFSGGYTGGSQLSSLTYQVKQTTSFSVPSPGGVYALSTFSFTSRLLGTATLTGSATLK